MYSGREFVARDEWLDSARRFVTLNGCVYSNFPENLRVFIDRFSCNNLQHSRTFVYLFCCTSLATHYPTLALPPKVLFVLVLAG